MSFLRRILGLFVMFAGIIGLLLSLAGLVGIWTVRPATTSSLEATIDTLYTITDTSLNAITLTYDALGATIDSVDALSEMLNTTALALEDAPPVINQANSLMGERLPASLQAATDALLTAQAAAESLESAITSFDRFRTVLSGAPLLSAIVPAPAEPYDPEKPLAVSLGEVASNIQDMPTSLVNMAAELDNVDEHLADVKSNLETMSERVTVISSSLEEYQSMIRTSQESMETLRDILSNIQNNLNRILNIATIILVLFFLWLLATQIVIFSQGWELYHGTAGTLASGEVKPVQVESESAESESVE